MTEFSLRSIMVPAYGPTLVNAIGHGAVLPVVALQARALGGDLGVAALVVALIGVGQLVNALPAGSLVARVGERRALLLTGGVEAAAMAGAALTDSLLLFAILMTVTGATWTVFLLARQGFVIDSVPVAYRARALSTLGGSHRVGLVVGPLVGALLIDRLGLAATFGFAAVMSTSAALLAQSMPDLGAVQRSALGAPESVWRVLRSHSFVLLTLGSSVAVISGARALRLTLLPLWCDHIGLSAAQTSLMFGIAAAVDATLFYPAGWVMDRFGRRWVAFPVVATVAVGVLLLPLAHSFGSVLAIAVLIAIGNGMGSGIVMTLGADSAPAAGRAQFLGGWRLCSDIGNTGAPALVSLITTVAPLATACLAAGALGVVGTVWVTGWTRRLDLARAS